MEGYGETNNMENKARPLATEQLFESPTSYDLPFSFSHAVIRAAWKVQTNHYTMANSVEVVMIL